MELTKIAELQILCAPNLCLPDIAVGEALVLLLMLVVFYQKFYGSSPRQLVDCFAPISPVALEGTFMPVAKGCRLLKGRPLFVWAFSWGVSDIVMDRLAQNLCRCSGMVLGFHIHFIQWSEMVCRSDCCVQAGMAALDGRSCCISTKAGLNASFAVR
ncbi:hypothetical protein [uncultured Cohaesibacter sp.]|uniref:hypothetical protein n=1 Tax=uncultured Cohaesibacter sp. TaxID=1002546 RepID=UPI0029C97366|nr:hypothetical protein [uncultured Cohaesibacter sp.]